MMLDIVYICFHIATIGMLGFIINKLLKANKAISIIKHKLRRMNIDVDDFLNELVNEEPAVAKQITAVGPNINTKTKLVDPEQIAVYKQRIAEVISGGNAKEYLGKQITLDQLGSMSDKELTKCYAIYEAKLGLKMTKSLGQSILSFYTASISHLFPIDDQEKLTKDLGDDPIITSSLSSISSYLYFSYGGILAPLATAAITFSHIKKLPNKIDNNIVIDDGTDQQTE